MTSTFSMMLPVSYREWGGERKFFNKKKRKFEGSKTNKNYYHGKKIRKKFFSSHRSRFSPIFCFLRYFPKSNRFEDSFFHNLLNKIQCTHMNITIWSIWLQFFLLFIHITHEQRKQKIGKYIFKKNFQK